MKRTREKTHNNQPSNIVAAGAGVSGNVVVAGVSGNIVPLEEDGLVNLLLPLAPGLRLLVQREEEAGLVYLQASALCTCRRPASASSPSGRKRMAASSSSGRRPDS